MGAAIALMVQGDFETAAIGLLVVAMIVYAGARPFARMEPRDRRSARITATALVLAGWLAVGALLWEWDGTYCAVAAGVGASERLAHASLAAPPPPTE